MCDEPKPRPQTILLMPTRKEWLTPWEMRTCTEIEAYEEIAVAPGIRGVVVPLPRGQWASARALVTACHHLQTRGSAVDGVIAMGLAGSMGDQVGAIIRGIEAVDCATGETVRATEGWCPTGGLTWHERRFLGANQLVTQLSEHRDVDAVDMVTFGLMQAAQAIAIPSLHLAFVTDHGDDRAREQFAENESKAPGAMVSDVMTALQDGRLTIEREPTLDEFAGLARLCR